MHELEQGRLWWESVTEEERQQVTRQRELERKAAQEASEQVAAEQAARRAAEAEAARQAAAREAAEHQRRIDTVAAKHDRAAQQRARAEYAAAVAGATRPLPPKLASEYHSRRSGSVYRCRSRLRSWHSIHWLCSLLVSPARRRSSPPGRYIGRCPTRPTRAPPTALLRPQSTLAAGPGPARVADSPPRKMAEQERLLLTTVVIREAAWKAAKNRRAARAQGRSRQALRPTPDGPAAGALTLARVSCAVQCRPGPCDTGGRRCQSCQLAAPPVRLDAQWHRFPT